MQLPQRTIGADICPQRLRARGWNRPGRIPVLAPGGEVTVASPELSPSQRSATVTLGTTAGDVVVTLSEEDARYRRFSRTACLLVAGRLARQDLVTSGILEPNAKALIDAGNFLALSAIGKYLTACLAFVDDSLVGSARPVALRAPSTGALRARAAAAACPVSRVPVRLSASQATSLLHIDAKRAGAPPPTLRVTCRTTAAGMQVRVSPRRPGIGLRKLVGPRLKVGLVRVPKSTQHGRADDHVSPLSVDCRADRRRRGGAWSRPRRGRLVLEQRLDVGRAAAAAGRRAGALADLRDGAQPVAADRRLDVADADVVAGADVGRRVGGERVGAGAGARLEQVRRDGLAGAQQLGEAARGADVADERGARRAARRRARAGGRCRAGCPRGRSRRGRPASPPPTGRPRRRRCPRP